MKKWLLVIIIAIALIMAFAFGWWFAGNDSSSNVVTKTKKPLYWVAPMDANYRRDKPGKSPMGMDLVPVYEEQGGDENSVKISPAVENNLGVKVATVKRQNLSESIHTFGTVVPDENNMTVVNSYVAGWVKKLYVNVTGSQVKQGDKLFALYSPQLVNIQQELLLAVVHNNASLVKAAQDKLMAYGLTAEQVQAITAENKVRKLVNVYASQDGVVTEINVRKGQYVKPEQRLLTINDLTKVWAIGEVFAKEVNQVAVGQKAVARFSYFPGMKWVGKVEYIYPQLDEKTHAMRLRFLFNNSDLKIKPQMYASITISGKPLNDVIALPKQAIIHDQDGTRVILALGDGRYKAQSVVVGAETDKFYVINSGIRVGDKVVTSAQFLIDSEANKSVSMDRMNEHKHD